MKTRIIICVSNRPDLLEKQIQLLKNSKKNYVNVHKFLENKMDKIFINFLKNNNENGQSFIKLASNLNGNEDMMSCVDEGVIIKLKNDNNINTYLKLQTYPYQFNKAIGLEKNISK